MKITLQNPTHQNIKTTDVEAEVAVIKLSNGDIVYVYDHHKSYAVVDVCRQDNSRDRKSELWEDKIETWRYDGRCRTKKIGLSTKGEVFDSSYRPEISDGKVTHVGVNLYYSDNLEILRRERRLAEKGIEFIPASLEDGPFPDEAQDAIDSMIDTIESLPTK